MGREEVEALGQIMGDFMGEVQSYRFPSSIESKIAKDTQTILARILDEHKMRAEYFQKRAAETQRQTTEANSPSSKWDTVQVSRYQVDREEQKKQHQQQQRSPPRQDLSLASTTPAAMSPSRLSQTQAQAQAQAQAQREYKGMDQCFSDSTATITNGGRLRSPTFKSTGPLNKEGKTTKETLNMLYAGAPKQTANRLYGHTADLSGEVSASPLQGGVTAPLSPQQPSEKAVFNPVTGHFYEPTSPRAQKSDAPLNEFDRRFPGHTGRGMPSRDGGYGRVSQKKNTAVGGRDGVESSNADLSSFAVTNANEAHTKREELRSRNRGSFVIG